MKDRPEFIVGETYRYDEIQDWVWCSSGPRYVAPDTLLRRCEDADGTEYFEELKSENPNGLIAAAEAQPAVEELERRGLDILAIARVAGISQEAARRAAAGHGQVRRATRDALLQAAASVNGSSEPRGLALVLRFHRNLG